MTLSSRKKAADGVAFWNHMLQTLAFPTLTLFVLRVALAVPFWRSGILKWDGFLQINDTAITLFSDEFMLHLPGGPYPFPAPAVMAFLSGCAEVVLPVLLILGLASRTAALGLLIMTLIVQLTVPDGWPIHISWAAMALAIITWGAGRASLDHAVWYFFHRSTVRDEYPATSRSRSGA
ncbi:MAG: DoxX family protein [Rhizobiales bacterium]|nr:DoxX family protein [Hyphomicrobiales bacterium]